MALTVHLSVLVLVSPRGLQDVHLSVLSVFLIRKMWDMVPRGRVLRVCVDAFPWIRTLTRLLPQEDSTTTNNLRKRANRWEGPWSHSNYSSSNNNDACPS